jgi:hypothetical protein
VERSGVEWGGVEMEELLKISSVSLLSSRCSNLLVDYRVGGLLRGFHCTEQQPLLLVLLVPCFFVPLLLYVRLSFLALSY